MISGSTTNPVRGCENLVFSFQFSVFRVQGAVFSFQFSVFRVQNLEISSYSCDSSYSWFTIFVFSEQGLTHESNAVSKEFVSRLRKEGDDGTVRHRAVRSSWPSKETVQETKSSCLLENKGFVPRALGSWLNPNWRPSSFVLSTWFIVVSSGFVGLRPVSRSWRRGVHDVPLQRGSPARF